jgi:hypothetical protein
MANERFFAVPILNSHRREGKVGLQVDPTDGVRVALGMEVAYAAPTVFPSPSKFVERVFDTIAKSDQPLDKKVRARVLAVAQDEEAREPYLVASSARAHSVTGEISRVTAERLAFDRNGPAKLDAALQHPKEFALEMRFRDIRQLLFQVDGTIDPTKITVTLVAGDVPIVTFPLYVAPILPKQQKEC